MVLKKSRIIIVSLFYVLLPVSNAFAVEEVLSWHSDITVSQDASMAVTETIQVRAEGDKIKRGIYRDFPTTYKDRAGNRVTVDFTLLGVQRDGRPEPYHTRDQSNGIRIYAGKSDVFLKPGVYTYRISYRTDRQLGYFEEHDELYWNVTGNGWEMPIHKTTATVTLPSTVPTRGLKMAGYVGPQGSREQNVAWSVNSQGQVTYSSNRSLSSGEGLTIVLGWPKGFVAEPSRAQKGAHFLAANRNLGTALLGLVVLLIYYTWAWRKAGKDPDKGTIIPRFEPPENLSPAAMRYIMEMGFDKKAFASAIISLAVKGCLTITDESKAFGLSREYSLHKVETASRSNLSRGEQKILKRLFPGTTLTLKLENKNHKKVANALEALKDFLKQEYHKSAFVNNSRYMTIGALITIAVLALLGLSGPTRSGGPPILFIVVWFIPWTAATLFLWASRNFFAAAIFSFFLVAAGVAFAKTTSIAFMAALVFLVLINLLFYILLKAPTNLGRRIMDKIEGFKMYLSTAEEHRLEKLHPPDKTPELFEKYLPYALALEVDQQWSEKFADVLSAAAASREYSPGWYRGRHWNSMHTGQFASDLGSSLSSAISSSSSAPGSSSGFGGGGSSGGGGGGGGGGGW